jgi:hypothetical protein
MAFRFSLCARGSKGSSETSATFLVQNPAWEMNGRGTYFSRMVRLLSVLPIPKSLRQTLRSILGVPDFIGFSLIIDVNN